MHQVAHSAHYAHRSMIEQNAGVRAPSLMTTTKPAEHKPAVAPGGCTVLGEASEPLGARLPTSVYLWLFRRPRKFRLWDATSSSAPQAGGGMATYDLLVHRLLLALHRYR